nr:ATP synthase F0 subunit 8 [Cyperus stolonifer]
MPQLDKFTYFSQFFWLCLFFFTFYIAICNNGDGLLGISRILKLRNQLISFFQGPRFFIHIFGFFSSFLMTFLVLSILRLDFLSYYKRICISLLLFGIISNVKKKNNKKNSYDFLLFLILAIIKFLASLFDPERLVFCDSPEGSLDSTANSQLPPAEEAPLLPQAPEANLEHLGEQIRQGLKNEINDLLCARIESQLQANGILEMYRAWGVQNYGNERALIRQKADEVLVSIDLLDENNLYDLQDFATKLQRDQHQQWHDLDKVIKRSIWPQPPLG